MDAADEIEALQAELKFVKEDAARSHTLHYELSHNYIKLVEAFNSAAEQATAMNKRLCESDMKAEQRAILRLKALADAEFMDAGPCDLDGLRFWGRVKEWLGGMVR